MSYEDTCDGLGRRLRQIRRQRHLSQERAGELAGLDRVTIGYFEQNRRTPRLSTLWKLANVYDVELREFFDFEEGARAGTPADGKD